MNSVSWFPQRGVGVQVAIRQIPDMLGIPSHGTGPIQELVTDLAQLSKLNAYALAISLTVLVIIFGIRRISRRIPIVLIAVICLIVASYTFNLASYGVAMVGGIPSGLPKLGLPNCADKLEHTATALSCGPRRCS